METELKSQLIYTRWQQSTVVVDLGQWVMPQQLFSWVLFITELPASFYSCDGARFVSDVTSPVSLMLPEGHPITLLLLYTKELWQ